MDEFDHFAKGGPRGPRVSVGCKLLQWASLPGAPLVLLGVANTINMPGVFAERVEALALPRYNLCSELPSSNIELFRDSRVLSLALSRTLTLSHFLVVLGPSRWASALTGPNSSST